MSNPLQILALVPEARTAQRCLEVAWAAATVPAAEIEVLHVKVDPAQLVAADDEVAIQGLRVRQEGTAGARAAAVKSIVDTWIRTLARRDQSRVRWREIVGQEEPSVTDESHAADLIVVPAPHNLDGGDASHAAFRKSHRPLLFVPDVATADHFGRHIAIAWKATPQAQRAVQGAAVWLRRASRVSLIMVADGGGRSDWPGAERLLRQVGVSTEPVIAPAAGKPVGERLLATAHELGANALVMGAYRHADVVEWVLPSTTRYVLRHADLPLFLAN